VPRRLALHKNLPHLVALDISTPTTIHNVGDERQMHMLTDTFAEVFAMSRARCLLMSFSGFSNMAVWWGGPQLLSCHKEWKCCCAFSAVFPGLDHEAKPGSRKP
jgi:hypothetical protein